MSFKDSDCNKDVKQEFSYLTLSLLVTCTFGNIVFKDDCFRP